ncbi:hypothetical protein J132_06974 [Termitomyces sp. J132]|nr:hypothetical protein J132_06974 [Termitomyces sp. J132]
MWTLAAIPRRQASLLTQLRTRHCLLNQYLYQSKKVNSPTCKACNRADETVEHYLLHCATYQRQWQELSGSADDRGLATLANPYWADAMPCAYNLASRGWCGVKGLAKGS